ncbi:haloalkane dehalogenase [Blastococcus sp. KM273129]|uniref:haloalkane dehalogenase n=1 Tax=Blastococcus sp. KM273129 TaxID=2570315 RepID=UPI001EFFA60B|nr:haloalkane dehalogenase [Blastococcus sp. KM273129]MCF6735373.1 haloalkane dehalogenase [Blastococcus sp. KM273129]
MADDVSPEDPFPRTRITVGDAEMAYVDVGTGESIVFLHGNPTSSYLWRNVIPHVQHLGRCIAPDLVGMGESDKLPDAGPGTYSFATHAAYLEEFLDRVFVGDRVTLVLHDWGSGLGFDWAERHQDRVRGIAFTEAIVAPVTWDDWPAAARNVFQVMRGPDGEVAVLDKNVFVERVLPASVARGLTPGAHDRYRAPFARREDRWPTLEWPRQLPIEGEPTAVVEVVGRYGAWLAGSDVPKLFIDADPGSILVGRQREFVRTWPALTEVTVAGSHFVPEDSLHEIGRAVADWIPTLP